VSDPRILNMRDIAPTIHLGRGGRFVKSRVLPDDAVRIDRRSRWGNPFAIGPALAHLQDPITGMVVPFEVALTREDAVSLFRTYATMRLYWDPGWLEPLRGKALACWCAPEACHGDVIIELLYGGTP